jgi:peptidoglycan/LPS O-acetylase OafA/YrhL
MNTVCAEDVEQQTLVSVSTRIPSLDGIRAMAIALVLSGHAMLSHTWWIGVKLGKLGVTLFFVLSGYLITSILLRELENSGGISFKRFYWRRFLRICPAYWVFVLFMVGLSSAASLRSDEVWAALLYVSNYKEIRWGLRHTWSLSVEEQFYLLWPVLLSLAGNTIKSVSILTASLLIAPFYAICRQ